MTVVVCLQYSIKQLILNNLCHKNQVKIYKLQLIQHSRRIVKKRIDDQKVSCR